MICVHLGFSVFFWAFLGVQASVSPQSTEEGVPPYQKDLWYLAAVTENPWHWKLIHLYLNWWDSSLTIVPWLVFQPWMLSTWGICFLGIAYWSVKYSLLVWLGWVFFWFRFIAYSLSRGSSPRFWRSWCSPLWPQPWRTPSSHLDGWCLFSASRSWMTLSDFGLWWTRIAWSPYWVSRTFRTWFWGVWAWPILHFEAWV